MVIQRFMLDTNIVSFILSRRSIAARTRAEESANDHIVCISSITEGELLFGLVKSGSAATRRILELFLMQVRIYPWDSEAARAYGTLRARQEASGFPLQPLDTQIAAHARALGATLITHDRAFRHVDGLRTEDWATDR